jgi:hypothetical protein
MPNTDDSRTTSPKMLQYAVEATVQHEKQISRLVTKLEVRKDELQLINKKLNVDLDAFIKDLDKLQKTINELVNVLKSK